MLLAEKIECFKADFAQRGINEYVAAPPTWRLAWKLGFDVPPPHFMEFSQLVLFAGGLFGLLWGIAEVLFGWSSQGAAFIGFTAVIAGVLFGVCLGAYYRHTAGKLDLPPWHQYPYGTLIRQTTPPSASPAIPTATSALWNPMAAGMWSLLFSWAFGSFLLARNWAALGDRTKARRCMIWFYAIFPWMPLYGLIHYWTEPDPRSNEFSALPDLIRLAAMVIPYFIWAFTEVNPQTKFVKERLGDQYPRKPWGMPIVVGAVCLVSAYFLPSLLARPFVGKTNRGSTSLTTVPTNSPPPLAKTGSDDGAEVPDAPLNSRPPVPPVSIEALPIPTGARELTIRIGTIKATWWIQKLNPSLQSPKCYATSDTLIIDFNVDRSPWGRSYLQFAILVRLFDRNGLYLTHFTTAERYTAVLEAYKMFSNTYNRVARTPLVPKPVLLKPTGNRLQYQVNVRDLRDAAIVEMGFIEKD